MDSNKNNSTEWTTLANIIWNGISLNASLEWFLSGLPFNTSAIQIYFRHPSEGGKLWLGALAPTGGDLYILLRMFRMCYVTAFVYVLMFLMVRYTKFSHVYRFIRWAGLSRFIRIVNFFRQFSTTLMSISKIRRIVLHIHRTKTVELFPVFLAVIVLTLLCSVSTLCCNSIYGPKVRCLACYGMYAGFATFAFIYGYLLKPSSRQRAPPPTRVQRTASNPAVAHRD